ncbi:Mediator of RNA polymerase II transcription subunit [Trichinella spiralis]|uniref:Mediator of RNA polymerase II transcription subunit n=1 Tax=Trichinella spiralis TaxID=6334 RepID=A0ABR3KW65_TRISP
MAANVEYNDVWKIVALHCAAAISIDQLNLLAERLIKITETYKEVVPVGEDAQKSVPPSHDLFDMSFLLLHRLSQYYSTTTCLRPGDPFFKTRSTQLLKNVPLDLELASDVLSRLRVGQPGWLNIRTWYCIIDLIPSIVQVVLNEVLLDTISIEELKSNTNTWSANKVYNNLMLNYAVGNLVKAIII